MAFIYFSFFLWTLRVLSGSGWRLYERNLLRRISAKVDRFASTYLFTALEEVVEAAC